MVFASNKEEQLARYQLKLEDSNEIHQISPDHYTAIRLLPGISRTYSFSYNHPKPDATGLEFSLFATYGRLEICIGRDTGSATEKPNCIYQDTVDASLGGLIQSYRQFLFGSENINLLRRNAPGTYRIFISAVESCYLNLAVRELTATASNFLARDLTPGIPIIESPRASKDPLYYTFQLTGIQLPAAAIQITLTPIRGDYIMVLTTADTKPTLEQFIWKSDSHSILVTSGDLNYNARAVYTLGIFPVMKSDSVFTHGDLQFQLKWTFTGQNSVLQPGIPDYGKLTHRKACFIAEIKPTWKEVYIFKHGSSKNIDLYANLGNKHSAPTKTKHMYKALANWAGFTLNSADIAQACVGNSHQICNIYMCLYGKKHEEYSLFVGYDDKPITLQSGKTFHGALPSNRKTLKFIHYPKKGEPLDIEEYSGDSHLTMAATVVEDTMAPQFPSISEIFPTQRMGLQPPEIKHFTHEEIEKYKRPIALITVQGVVPSEAEQSFHLKSEFGLEAGFSIKELVQGVARIAEAEANTYSYFFFYNHEPIEPVFIKLNSLNGGDCDLYLGRGPNSRPTEKINIAKSNNYLSAYINLSPMLIRGKGFPNLVGYYVVAVKANQRAKFMLSWSHSNTIVTQGYFNQNLQGTLPPGARVVFKNTNFYDGGFIIQLRNNYVPINFYYRTAGKDRSYKQNDISLFPTSANSNPDYVFPDSVRISVFEIKKEDPIWCQHCDFFFTFENPNKQQPVEITFVVRPKTTQLNVFPEVISFGKTIENIGLKDSEITLMLSMNSTQIPWLADSFIESHVMYGSALMSLRTNFAVSYNSQLGMLAVSDMKKGYSTMEFPASAAQTLTTQSFPKLYIKIKFLEDTNYRLVIPAPNQMKELALNQPERGYLRSTTSKPDVFWFATNGNESRLDISFTIDHFMLSNSSVVNKNLLLSRNLLDKAVQVYFLKDKSLLSNYESFQRRADYQHLDEVNQNIDFEFKPVKGIYVVRVASPSGDAFKYKLEVTTNFIRNVMSDSFTVSYVQPGEAGSDFFQFTSELSGNAFIKAYRCAGNVDFKASPSTTAFGGSLNLEDGKYVDFWAPNHPQQRVYLKAEARPEVANRHSSYLSQANQTAVYSFQIVQRTKLGSSSPFSTVVPFNDDINMDLSGRQPVVSFRPLNLTEEWIAHGQHQYFVVVSRDPALCKYYVGCGDYYLRKLLRPGVKQSDVLWVFKTEKSPNPLLEKSTGLPYLSVTLDIPSGRRYFLSIYAVASDDAQSLIGDPSTENRPRLGQIKVVYESLDFEFKSYFYPLELLAASVGMLCVFLLAVAMFWFSCISKFKRGKAQYQNTDSGADAELEDYYLQIKQDFNHREAARKQLSQSSASSVQLDESSVSGQTDTSSAQVILDESTSGEQGASNPERTAELTNL